jgi:gamma-glutamyltranspeptidase/glutathione hydrolase
MVACPHYLASEAGLKMLRRGGSAVDAAIATNAALGVVYPHMTGLGGDAFWLIYDAQSKQVLGLNGSGRAGQQVIREVYTGKGLSTIPKRGPLAANTVPGAVDSWWQAHQQFGSLPWEDLLQPAIDLAEQGFPISHSQRHWTKENADALIEYSGRDNPFLPDGELPEAKGTFKNPPLALTLRNLATEGVDEFYQGKTAREIAAFLQDQGGLLTEEDFASHNCTWVEPIFTAYRGYRIYEMPPNSQGFTLLQILNLLEPFDLQQIGHDTADYYHLLVEATKLSFADRDRWLSDPEFVEIPIEALVSKEYCDRRRARINMSQAQTYQAGIVGGDTTYSAFIDARGNAVSLIQSLYFDFGSAVVPPKLGFPLQNRGSFFSLDPDHINTLEPGKRTFHTLMPGLVLNGDGSLYCVYGTMGGEGQPQTQIAILTRVLDFGFDPQTAIDLPRWLWGRTWGEDTTGLTLEGRISESVRAELQKRGHEVKPAPDWTEKMGHAHMIQIDPKSSLLRGGSDPRSDGTALGL